jgi:methylated-DNA-[protein]-cysteine S-methyltransferase
MHCEIRHIETPIGRYTLAASADGLTRVEPEAGASRASARRGADPETTRHVDAAERALLEYFAGERQDFRDLVIAPQGSPFQRRVWHALRAIPFGQTASYGEIAHRIGRDGAARAVGSANHANPLSIVVPCHRVVGADGGLTGYAGGLDRKRWLLSHEHVDR